LQWRPKWTQDVSPAIQGSTRRCSAWNAWSNPWNPWKTWETWWTNVKNDGLIVNLMIDISWLTIVQHSTTWVYVISN
jgi:hypothetical protein